MTVLREHLLDVHERAHRSLTGMIAHASEFKIEEADREHVGFGYPSLRLQIHHVIGAERYWISVLDGEIDAGDDSDRFPSVPELESLRVQVADRTRSLLGDMGDEDLQMPKRLRNWRGDELLLVPAQVVLRTQTHLFHHLGQMTAICRLLDRPINGLDYPLD